MHADEKRVDFTNARPNPYASRLKRAVTIRLDEATIAYFKELADETGPAGTTPSPPVTHVKLMDFGLARLTGPNAEQKGLGHGMVSLANLALPTMSSPLTKKGRIVGTLQYRSPEQLKGEDIDTRTDIFAFGVARAQSPPDATCTTYPSGQQWQTIVVRLVDGDCRIDPYESNTAIPLLRTFVGDRAFWDVCNLCGAPVDVRISDAFPQSMSAIFERFTPPIDASESSVATSVPTGQTTVFGGDVSTDDDIGGTLNKYDIAVKFSTEGPGGWDQFDPELQIDDDFNLAAILLWIGAGLVGVAAGLGVGYAFAARRYRQAVTRPGASGGASSA